MLQDQIRTGTYYAAILENTADFHGKIIMDVGAGSGILSLFAAQVPHCATWLAAGAPCNRMSSMPFVGKVLHVILPSLLLHSVVLFDP